MLSPQVMGLAALGLAWITAVMIALDALIDARAMWKRLGEWKTTLLQGTVVANELAVHEVEQRVKQLDGDEPGLVFFDRKHVSTVTGGLVSIGTEQLEVTGARAPEVWIDSDTRAAAAGCSSQAAFDGMNTSAQAAGGGLRTVRTSIKSGAQVWISGAKQGSKVEATLVANFDPRGWAKSRLARIAGMITLNFAWVAGGTVVALWPPVFGVVSTLGAMVLIGHFLGMTALAMTFREKSRTPAVAFLRGTWRRAHAQAAVLAPVSARSSGQPQVQLSTAMPPPVSVEVKEPPRL